MLWYIGVTALLHNPFSVRCLIIIHTLLYSLQQDVHKDVWMFGSNDAFTLKISVSWNDKQSLHNFYVTILVKNVSHQPNSSLSNTQTDRAGCKVYLSCIASILCFYKNLQYYPNNGKLAIKATGYWWWVKLHFSCCIIESISCRLHNENLH